MAILLLALDFADVLVDGKFQITLWYLSVLLFLKALLIGGVEEIGWRYTFQPILEEKINYLCIGHTSHLIGLGLLAFRLLLY